MWVYVALTNMYYIYIYTYVYMYIYICVCDAERLLWTQIDPHPFICYVSVVVTMAYLRVLVTENKYKNALRYCSVGLCID